MQSLLPELLPWAERASALLKARGETIAVAESSAGGLIAAALLAVPGASAWFLGGVVVYTRAARRVLLDIPDAALDGGVPPSTEAYAALLARAAQGRLGTIWGLGETGATGPAGNRYGYPAGHACLAVAGPVERTTTIETGSPDRQGNMRAFGAAALRLLVEALEAAPGPRSPEALAPRA